jgi:serine/threonine protein kinase
MSLSEFKITKFLGKGSFGTVHKVIRKTDNKEYALKEVQIKYMSQQERYL